MFVSVPVGGDEWNFLLYWREIEVKWRGIIKKYHHGKLPNSIIFSRILFRR